MRNETREVVDAVRRIQRRRPATAAAVAEVLGATNHRDVEQLLEAMVDRGLLESIVMLTRASAAEAWTVRRRSYQVVRSAGRGELPPAAPREALAERAWGAVPT